MREVLLHYSLNKASCSSGSVCLLPHSGTQPHAHGCTCMRHTRGSSPHRGWPSNAKPVRGPWGPEDRDRHRHSRWSWERAQSRAGQRARPGRGPAGRGAHSEPASCHSPHVAWSRGEGSVSPQSHPRKEPGRCPSQSPKRGPAEAKRCVPDCEDPEPEGPAGLVCGRRQSGVQAEAASSPPALAQDPRTPSCLCFPCSVVSRVRTQQAQLHPSQPCPWATWLWVPTNSFG